MSKKMSGHLIAFEMDVTIDEQVENAKNLVTDHLMQSGKQLHAVVNNVGIIGNYLVDDVLTLDDYKKAFDVNALSVIRTVKAFKSLIKQSRGRIITCVCSATRFVIPGFGPYTTSKCASKAYMETIRHELYPFGVTVVTIEPGQYQTDGNDAGSIPTIIDAVWKRATPEQKNEYGEYFAAAAKKVSMRLNQGSPTDISPVIDAYFHAIAAKWPYKSYLCGTTCKLLHWPYSFLPVAVQEVIMAFFGWLYTMPPYAHC
ncbi:hypothetical protein AB6A40_006126 [Gnathostoma spinigerum]|uniref:Uncharacterized protein n=1 Tax=Gnathostoma spinigerum TaxID=75299 RepID=A0ABD6ES86_9BILA